MKILVVDDLATNRKLFRALLEADGYNILEAADGIEALAILKKQHVDAVISDILMPRMDGYRLSCEIRKNKQLKHLPIIIASSTYTSPADAKLAMEAGADKYFKKPVLASDLVAALKEFASNPKYKQARASQLPDEATVMKEYSEALVRKLEEKNTELEKTQAELFRLNRGLEDRIKEAVNDLEVANSELEAFNRSVSHDLKGPLTEVLAYAQLIEQDQRSEFRSPSLDFSGKITAAARRMNTIISQLMNLSRSKHGELRRRPLDLTATVKEIAARLQDRDPARKVQFVIPAGLTAEADPDLLPLALDNLLGNAWKYTGKRAQAVIEFGAMERRGENPPSPTQDSKAPVFFIRDNGAGFDMPKAKRLFQPFERFHSSSEFAGTGVGLTIVQRIIARHGGRIWAESCPGKGSTFSFTLTQ